MEPHGNKYQHENKDQGELRQPKSFLPNMYPRYAQFRNLLHLGLRNTQMLKEAEDQLRMEGNSLLAVAVKYKPPQHTKDILELAKKIPGYRFQIVCDGMLDKRPEITLLLLDQLELQQDNINPRSREGHSLLHFAADRDYLEIAEKIVQVSLVRGERSFECLYMGRTPLFIAIQSGSEKVAEFLMQYTDNINPTLDNGATAMHVAAEAGSIKTLDLLMKKFRAKQETIDIRTPCKGSLLHTAAGSGQVAVYQFIRENFIETGGEIYPRDAEGMSPLHFAVMKNKIKMISYLLVQPIAANQYINSGDNHGFTPLHEAVENGYIEATKILLEALLANGETISPITYDAKRSCSPFQSALYKLKKLIKDKAEHSILEKEIENYFDIIELFLKCPSFAEQLSEVVQDNFMSLCVDYKRVNAIKSLLPKLINEWKKGVINNLINIPLWYDIYLGAVFQNSPEILHSILQELPLLDPEQVNLYKKECLDRMLFKQCSIDNNFDIVKPIFAFLKNYEAVENILTWLKGLEKDAKRSNDKILEKFLSYVHQSMIEEPKKLNSFVKKKIKILKAIPWAFQGTATPGNENLLDEIDQCYKALCLFATEAEKSLESCNDISTAEQSALNFERELSSLLEKYQATKQRFFFEETRLKLAEKEGLNTTLQGWENKLRLSLQHSSIKKTKETLDLPYVPNSLKSSLREQYQAFEKDIGFKIRDRSIPSCRELV